MSYVRFVLEIVTQCLHCMGYDVDEVRYVTGLKNNIITKWHWKTCYRSGHIITTLDYLLPYLKISKDIGDKLLFYLLGSHRDQLGPLLYMHACMSIEIYMTSLLSICRNSCMKDVACKTLDQTLSTILKIRGPTLSEADGNAYSSYIVYQKIS